MKTMKKLVALFAAATMAMSISISAFAEVIANPDMYDAEAGELTFYVGEGNADISISSEEQVTLLAYLVSDETTIANVPEYSDQEIIAIGQVGGSVGFKTVPVDTDKLEAGYAIALKLGGSDGTVETFLIAYNDETGELEFTYGDLNNDGAVDTTDAGIALSKFVNSSYEMVVPDKYADVNGDGTIDTTDAGWILSKFVNSQTVFPAEG